MNKNTFVSKVIPTIIVIMALVCVGLVISLFFDKQNGNQDYNGITFKLESNSGNTYVNGKNKEVNISGENYGDVTCESTNYEFAKCFVANSKLYIIPGEKVGSATITLTDSISGMTIEYVVNNLPEDQNAITLKLSEYEGTAYTNGSSIKVQVSGKNYGTLICSTSNENIATCSISGTTLTITPKSTTGEVTITLKEYKEGNSVDYVLNVEKSTTTKPTTPSTTTKPNTVVTNPTTLTLSKTSGTTAVNGDKLTATISGKNYGNLTCSSNNTKIATCEISGTKLTIKPVSAGTAVITVKESKNGKTVKYTATIQKVALSLKETEGIASIGGNVLTTKIIANSYDKLSCTSSNDTVATCLISDDILIIFPKSIGTSTIKVKDSKENKEVTYNVIVQKDPVVSLSLTSKEGSTYLDGNDLTTKILGTNYGKLTCISSNTSIATCEISGTTLTIKPNKITGVATITVKESNTNKTITYKATIKKYVTLALEKTQGATTVNGQVLSVNIIANTYDKLSCTSLDTTIATCSIKENVLLVFPKSKEGTTTITVKDSKENKEVTYSVKIQTNPVVSLYLSETIGKTFVDGAGITTTILGSNYGDLSCLSSDKTIAECFISGNKLIITPTTNSGEVYIFVSESSEYNSATYTLTVEDHPSLSLSKTSGDMAIGSTSYVSVTAKNHGELTCTSSNTKVATCKMIGSLLYITAGNELGSSTIVIKEGKENKTVTYIVNTFPKDYTGYSCSKGKLQRHDTLGYICVIETTVKTTQKYECLADIYEWSCPEKATNCTNNALASTYNTCIESGCEVVSISHPTTGSTITSNTERFFDTFKGTCKEIEPNIKYSCEYGWLEYGTDKNLLCYKKAN